MNDSHSRIRLLMLFPPVDENLFYKGVDKSAVHGARLHQTHSLSEPLLDDTPPSGSQGKKPSPETMAPEVPYPFESGNSLLALTKKHNVRIYLFCPEELDV